MNKHKSRSIYSFFKLRYLIFLIFPALIINKYWRDKLLNSEYDYTITKTIREFNTLKNGIRIEHTYNVNGVIYKTDYIINTNKKVIVPNGLYLLKYSKCHPEISKVLWDSIISDSIAKHNL